jgi:flagellar protein FlaG
MQVESIISTADIQTGVAATEYKSAGNKRNVSVAHTAEKPNRPDEVILSDTELSIGEVEKALKNLREYAGWGNFNIGFSIDDQTGSLIIKIIDRDTGEMLRQIPTDQILALRSHLQEMLKSVLDHLA